MKRKNWPKAKYKDLVEELFSEGKLLINNPSIARELGKELNRLEVRADVFIGRDQAYGKSIAVVIGTKNAKHRGWSLKI